MPIGPISFVPKGLLDFLGVRSQAKYPRDVADVIATILDVTKLVSQSSLEVYESELGLTLSTSGGGSFSPSNVFYVQDRVPENEFWWVRKSQMQISLSSGTGAIGSVLPSWGFTVNSNVPIHFFPNGSAQLFPSLFSAHATDSQVIPTWSSGEDFFLPPGAHPQFTITNRGFDNGAGSTSATVFFRFEFNRLRTA